MPVAGGGFEQCYNAQAVVATESLLVIATDVAQAPNDKQQIAPVLEKVDACRNSLAGPKRCWAGKVLKRARSESQSLGPANERAAA
jgi:hypothetical protein